MNFSLGQVDLLVATPGVLLRLLRQDEHFGIERRLIGSNLRHIIVDEADTLLDITFGPAVVEIIRRLEVKNNFLTFSHVFFFRSTFNPSTMSIIKLHQRFN